MPLVKTYQRYSLLSQFSVVGSGRCNTVLLEKNQDRPKSSFTSSPTQSYYAATGAVENVVIWDIKKAEQVMVLYGDQHEVTAIATGKNNKILAAGYSNGSIKIWDLREGNDMITLSGHKYAITSLQFDSIGARLVSGSRDTDVIVWDVINECGLYRFKGHKGEITKCHFMKTQNVLITSSKDTLVKFWDLDTQHCFLTLVGHRSEVWGFVAIKNETRLVTGSSDSELRIWRIDVIANERNDNSTKKLSLKRKETDANLDDGEGDDERDGPISCEYLGSILRQGRDRVAGLILDSSGKYLACHGTDSMLEIFKVLNEDEIKKGLRRKLKSLKRKERGKPESERVNEEDLNVEQKIEDEIQTVQTYKLKSKVRSCDMIVDSSNDLKVLLLFSNNSVGFYKIDHKQTQDCVMTSNIAAPGHRSDPRTVCFNTEGTCILSGSAESVKVWNRSTLRCIRTFESEYSLCSFFVPGDRHAVVGTKTGKLQLYDVAAGVLLEKVDAHEGAIWGLSLSPNKKGFVSGSADHMVKFWEFELISDAEYSETTQRLSMVHTRTLKMSEDILAVKYSPDQRLLAVSLLDSTVKVFFSDTLKFFLSLYGHKLPVLCMDISSDSNLLITGSSDKNIKIWGLDFGDCHKSIFAHDDSIMDIKFVPRTHYFFSVSKDKTVKYWDADKYENITTMKGHQSEIWCLGINRSGDYLVTGSHDKSLRLWERTEELLVVEEEREQEREEEFEKTLAEGGEPVIPGEKDTEAGFAGKKTLETMKGAEKIMEALELCSETEKILEEHKMQCKQAGKELPPPQVSPILRAYGNISPLRYVLEVLRKIRSSEIEESLIVLPFSYVIDLLKIINRWVENSWEIELSSRCLFFLLRIHHNQIVANQVLLDTILSAKQIVTSKLKEIKDQIGVNMAGLKYMQSEMESNSMVFFADATEKLKKKKKKKVLLNYS
eukprot:gene233-850_t